MDDDMDDDLTKSEGAPEDEAPPELPAATMKEPKVRAAKVAKATMAKPAHMKAPSLRPRRHERRY